MTCPVTDWGKGGLGIGSNRFVYTLTKDESTAAGEKGGRGGGEG